jgi:hypothetical protein
MNFKIQSMLGALALSTAYTVQAGPGSRDPGANEPRPVVVSEVTTSCPRCPQITASGYQHSAKAKAKRIASADMPRRGKMM